MDIILEYIHLMVKAKSSGGNAESLCKDTPSPLKNGLWYVGVEDYILTEGNAYLSAALDEVESKILSNAARGFKGQVKKCYQNAQKLVLRDKSNTLTYVEGYAMMPLCPFPLEHGWVELNGKVIDPTWPLETCHSGALSGHPVGILPEGWAYYGVRFSRGSVVERHKRYGEHWSHIFDWSHRLPLLSNGPRSKPLQKYK